MKVAVTSVGRGLDDAVDRRFGRCRYIVVVDTMTQEVDVVANEALQASSGAGVRAVRELTDREAGAVITGSCGPHAFRALQAAGIALYTGAEGTVGECVQQLVAGELAPADEPNVGAKPDGRGGS
jgi:predicted Fe-Mo cluster-binding NifX family protein